MGIDSLRSMTQTIVKRLGNGIKIDLRKISAQVPGTTEGPFGVRVSRGVYGSTSTWTVAVVGGVWVLIHDPSLDAVAVVSSGREMMMPVDEDKKGLAMPSWVAILPHILVLAITSLKVWQIIRSDIWPWKHGAEYQKEYSQLTTSSLRDVEMRDALLDRMSGGIFPFGLKSYRLRRWLRERKGLAG